MALLGAYGEDTSFPLGSAVGVQTISTPGGGRCAVYSGNSTVTRSKPLPGGAVTSCWFSYQVYNGTYSSNWMHAGLGHSSYGNSGLWIRHGTGGKLQLITYDGASAVVLASEAGASLNNAAWNKIDVEILSYGAAATVNVYYGGTASAIISFTGDVTISGITSLDTVLVQGEGSSRAPIAEIMVADEDTRAMLLHTAYDDGAGDLNEWDGDGFGGVDEITISDADLIYTNTAGETFLATTNNLAAGTYRIVAVKREARALATNDAAISGMALGIKSGGTVSVDTADALIAAYDTYEHLMTVNPVTGVAFTQAEINALQSAIQSAV